jgi:TRAP-type C4-dicarboxylate transport system permease small subunit
MKQLDALNNVLNRISMFLGGISLLAVMLLATGNVALRIFHRPFSGTYEIVSFLGAVVIAFALGYTQKEKDHIVVTILTERFPEKLQRVIGMFAELVIMVFFAIVAWQIYVWGMKIYESHEVSETLKLPFYPFVFAVAAGFVLLSFSAFVGFMKQMTQKEVE